jgi:hypothetical protein
MVFCMNTFSTPVLELYEQIFGWIEKVLLIVELSNRKKDYGGKVMLIVSTFVIVSLILNENWIV